MPFRRIVVLGAGAWGTALAHVLAVPGRAVQLWSRHAETAAAIAAARENRRSLPGVRLAEGVEPTASLATVASADLLLVAVPTQSIRALLERLPPAPPDCPVLLTAKGIEAATGLFPSEIVAALRPAMPVAALSGPSFAADVGRGRPTAVTIGARAHGLARALAEDLALPRLRLYHTDDLSGVEIGGAAKNVLAIACGIAAGLDLGASASAALIARGFAELARFGAARGARAETLMGLSGLGDLVLTCSSAQSRNFAFGHRLGQGLSAEAAGAGVLVEGAHTAPILAASARQAGVDMPIVEAVCDILAGVLGPLDAIERLLARPPRAESVTPQAHSSA